MKTKHFQMLLWASVMTLFSSSCSKLDEFCGLLNHHGHKGEFDSSLFRIKEIDVANSQSEIQYLFNYNTNNDIASVAVYSEDKGMHTLLNTYKVTYEGRKISKVTTTSHSGNYIDDFHYYSPGQLSHYRVHNDGVDIRTYNLIYNSKGEVDSFGYAGEHKNADFFNFQYDHQDNISQIHQYDFFGFPVDSLNCSYDNKLSPFHAFLKNWYAIHMNIEDDPFNGSLSYYWAEATFSEHNIVERTGRSFTGEYIKETLTNSYDKKSRLIKQVIYTINGKIQRKFTLSIFY